LGGDFQCGRKKAAEWFSAQFAKMEIMKRSWLIGGVITAAVVLLAGWGMWRWQQNPSRAFWDMLANNLSTPGVTRIVSQNSQGLEVSQYTQTNFGAQPSAHALTIFKQNGGTIATEEISNSSHDLVRYQKIVTTRKNAAGKPLDVSSVVNKWAELKPGSQFSSAVASGLFDQSLQGILPIANLNSVDRSRLLTYMHDNAVFSFDAGKVKTVTAQGHRAYQYDVQVQPAAYVGLMQQFGHLIGATGYDQLDPNEFSGASKIALTVTVDAFSHTLLTIDQPASGRTERYESFGTTLQPALPHATLTTAQLEQRITDLR
jgi:hypothetical protein